MVRLGFLCFQCLFFDPVLMYFCTMATAEVAPTIRSLNEFVKVTTVYPLVILYFPPSTTRV